MNLKCNMLQRSPFYLLGGAPSAIVQRNHFQFVYYRIESNFTCLSFGSCKVLSRGYTCDYLLALATRHHQTYSATEVESVCKCSQVSPISATYSKMVNSQNVPLTTSATSWFHCPCSIRMESCATNARKMSLSLINLLRSSTRAGNFTSSKLFCDKSWVSTISSTCRKKFNSMSILGHCPSYIIAEPATF